MSTQHLITEPAVLLLKKPYADSDSLSKRYAHKLRVLVADNRPSALSHTCEFLRRAGFEVIPVNSQMAASLVIYFNVESLNAIILDGRLTKDDSDKDRSGYLLAHDTLRQFDDCPPIIIFSMFDDRRHIDLKPDAVSFVSKREGGHERLVERVIELIEDSASDAPRKSPRPSNSPLPVFILADEGGDAEKLGAELANYGVEAWTHVSLSALEEAAPYLPAAMFVVDLDAGRSHGGADTARSLKRLEEELRQPFYVVALSGRAEGRHEAGQVGAIFLPKASAEMDALELITRMAQYKMELDRAAAVERLAAQGYKKLLEQLEEVSESPGAGMSAPIETVRRALNWPFLTPKEQLVLSSLYTQMLAARSREADAKTLAFCIAGASLLADGRARDADVGAWLESARRHSPDFTLTFLPEEVFDGDPEESDD